MNHTATLLPDRYGFACPEDRTLLEAANAAGLLLPHSCQNGICGQCRADLVEGEVERGIYAESALPAEEAAHGKILLCCARPKSSVVLRVPGYNGMDAPPVRTMPVRVAQIVFPSSDTAVLTLDLPKAPSFRFLAGQFIEILLKNGKTRSYSIASAPDNTAKLELHIRCRPGGLFGGMLTGSAPEIAAKSVLRIRGPLGSAVYGALGSTEPLLFAATGTGIAPVLSMLRSQELRESGRAVHVYWGARRREDFYGFDEAAAAVESLPGGRFVPVLSQPDAGWTGRTGYVQHAVQADFPALSGFYAYAAGAPEMVRDAEKLFTGTCGLNPEHFLADPFTPAL